MNIKTTGLDGAALIPIGATLVKAAWFIPGLYTEGAEYPSRLAALEYIASLEPKSSKTLDLRWKLAYPNGGGQDLVIQRIVFGTMEDVQYMIDAIKRTPEEYHS
jgi:hypothetical protein